MPGMRSRKVLFWGHFAVIASCLCLAQSPTTPSATATVEGSVATTGLPDLTVRLTKAETDPLSPFDGYVTTVEPDGRFRFEDVAPGDYRLTGGSSSQVYGELGSTKPGIPGTVLELKAGEDLKNLTLEVFPDPVGFCGRVLDADGKPLRTDVEVYSPQFIGPTGETLQLTRDPIVLTDSNGYFKIAGSEQLAVGPAPQYIVPSFNQQYSRFFLRANGVWYPSTENFADALAIPARPISQSGCDAVIQMPRTRCVGHRVIGKVEGMPASMQSSYEISLYEVNPANVLFEADSQPSIYNTGHVEFDDVCDGSYAILTWPDRPIPPGVRSFQNYASRLFHVDGKDTDVTIAGTDQQEIWKLTNQQDIWTRTTPNLPPPAPASLQGSLQLVDGLTWKQACPAGVSQQLRLERRLSFEQGRRRGNRQAAYATLDKEGQFSFDKLEPGSYSLDLGSFAHGAAYLKSIELNGQPLPLLDFTLAAGEAAQLKVEVSNDPSGAAGKPRAGNTPPHYLPTGTHPAASIAGRVTGPDAAGAKLKLIPLRAGWPTNFDSSAPEATAGSDGRFHFEGVTPGMYRLSTEGEHHQYSEYGAKGPGMFGLAVAVTAGQHRRGLEMKTYARPSVCGTVFGANGHPLPGIEVWVRDTTNDSQGNLTKHAVTDEKGRYTISDAGPGERRLSARDGDIDINFPSGPGEDSHDGFADMMPEQKGCPFNFYLRRPDGGSALAHRVSGTVDGNFNASLGDRFYVELDPADREFTPSVERVQMKETGNFTLKNVWPGKYTLTLYGEYGNGYLPCGMPSSICMGYFHHPLATQQITVTNRNLIGLRLAVGTLPTLDGEFVVDGNLPQGWDSPAITLFWNNSNKTMKADANGHFSFPPLDAFRYGFSITGYPPEDAYQLLDYGPVYLASATLDGKPIVGRHFELHNGQKAHLVIHLKVGATDGKLGFAAGAPPVDPYRDPCSRDRLSGGATTILMIPDPLPDDNSGIIGVVANPSENEVYLRSTPPGPYRVVAVNNVGIPTRSSWGQTPAATSHDFLVKLAALGRPVEVVAGQEFDFTAPYLTEQAQRLIAEMRMAAMH